MLKWIGDVPGLTCFIQDRNCCFDSPLLNITKKQTNNPNSTTEPKYQQYRSTIASGPLFLFLKKTLLLYYYLRSNYGY